MTLLILLIAVVSGFFNPMQGAANAELNKSLHTPVWAGATVYLLGFAGLLVAALAFRAKLPSSGALHAVPWWAWLGGVISIASTMAGLLLTQRLGSGVFTGASLTAAVICSVALDNWGLMGLKQHAATPGRLAGCALLIAGIWLVAKF